MRNWGICISCAFVCFLLIAKPANAQSNLLQADLGKGLKDADLSIHPNMVDLPLVFDGTIFGADPLSMRGDFSEDGGRFNISYRFGKTFMGFDGHFTGSTVNQDASLATSGIFGIKGLNIGGGATLRYRIGRILAPGVAVYGMVGTTSPGNKSFKIIQRPISADGSSTDLGLLTTALPDTANSSSDDDDDDDRSGRSGNSGDDDDDDHHSSNSGHNDDDDDDDDHHDDDAVSAATVASGAISGNTSAQQSSSTSSQSFGLSSGIILGGGIELVVGSGVYIRAEYNFVDLGTIPQTLDFTKTATDNLLSNGGLSSAKYNDENNIHSVGFSVLYKF